MSLTESCKEGVGEGGGHNVQTWISGVEVFKVEMAKRTCYLAS